MEMDDKTNGNGTIDSEMTESISNNINNNTINNNNNQPATQSISMDFDDESCLVQLPNRTLGSGLSLQQQHALYQQQLEREREARYKPPKLGDQFQCAEQPLLTEAFDRQRNMLEMNAKFGTDLIWDPYTLNRLPSESTAYNINAPEFSSSTFSQEIRKFPGPLQSWDESEKSLFESFMIRPQFKKKWKKVSKFLKTRNVHELVDFYYIWKAALKPNYLPTLSEIWRSHPLCLQYMHQQRYNLFANGDSEDEEGEDFVEASHTTKSLLLNSNNSEKPITNTAPQQPQTPTNTLNNTSSTTQAPSTLPSPKLDIHHANHHHIHNSLNQQQQQTQNGVSSEIMENILDFDTSSTSTSKLHNHSLNQQQSLKSADFEQPIVPESPVHTASGLISSSSNIQQTQLQQIMGSPIHASLFLTKEEPTTTTNTTIVSSSGDKSSVLRSNSNLFAKFKSIQQQQQYQQQRQKTFFDVSISADIDD